MVDVLPVGFGFSFSALDAFVILCVPGLLETDDTWMMVIGFAKKIEGSVWVTLDLLLDSKQARDLVVNHRADQA